MKWKNKVVEVTIQDYDGSILQGQLVHINDTSLYLYVSDDDYKLRANDSLTAYIPSDSINRIILHRNSLVMEGAKIGAISSVIAPIFVTIVFAIEGGLGYAVLAAPAAWLVAAITNTTAGGIIGHVNYIHADYKFDNQSGTFNHLKDEVKVHELDSDTVFFQHSGYQTFHNPNIQLKPYIRKQYDPLFYSRLSFNLGIGGSRSNAYNDIQSALTSQLVKDQNQMSFYDQSKNQDYSINIGVALLPHVHAQAGLTGSNSSSSLQQNSLGNEFSYTNIQHYHSFTSGRFGLEYIFNPTRRIRVRKHEFSIGGAIHFASYSSKYFVFENTETTSEEYSINADTRYTQGIGGYAKYRIFPIRMISLYISGGATAYKPFDTPITDISQIGLTKTQIESFSINYSSVNLIAGITFHIF